MGFVKVGSQTLAAQARARRASGYIPPPPNGAYQPYRPVVPAAAYNPTLDIELAAGKRGTQNTLEDLGTKDTRGAANFATDENEVKRQEAEQTAAHTRALAGIAQGFQRLAGRQREGANSAGLRNGSALAQAATKRAANESLQQTPVNQTFTTQQEGDKRSLARLALSRQQEAEDNATQRSRAEREQGQFAIDTGTVRNREATNNGYLDSGGVVSRTSTQPGAGFVKVGQPLKPW